MKKHCLLNLVKENPVFVSLLGIVPVLGLTIFAKQALLIGLATAFVLLFSNLFVSFVRSHIKPQTELLIYILVTAIFTTIVDVFIRLHFVDVIGSLGVYLPLIVVNCLILNNLKISSDENMKTTFVNSLKTCCYFIFAVVLVGALRELLGSGSIFGYELVPEKISRVLIFNTSAGGFFILAFLAFLANVFRGDKA